MGSSQLMLMLDLDALRCDICCPSTAIVAQTLHQTFTQSGSPLTASGYRLNR